MPNPLWERRHPCRLRHRRSDTGPRVSLTLILPSPVTGQLVLDLRSAVWNDEAKR